MVSNERINALIRLLDDPDEDIFTQVESMLFDIGLPVIDELERTWEGTLNLLLQHRIEQLIQKIQFANVRQNLVAWATTRENNLLEGAFWVARYQFSEIRYEDIDKQIEKLKHDVWLELNSNLTALEKVKIINHIMFDVNKLSGNIANFDSPLNSYINQVFETKKGNPVTLSIIYSVVAQRLNLPVYGVNLPKNFVLAYRDEISSLHAGNEDENEDILFYINPFNKGMVFGRKEIDLFIKQQKLSSDKSYYIPCSNIETIRRLLQYLAFSYEKMGYSQKLKDINDLISDLG
ncbi:MAG: transglutaminase-like domain-containing protein [Bacteroidia bacterium]|nr:transglutaminase-like domain-containing protein [Bacteroidia bacterium]